MATSTFAFLYKVEAKKMPHEPQKKDLTNLPAKTGEFIKLVINKMRYRKKVCTEVLEELTAHFTDALKNCKTEEEKQEAATQLIQEFGDPKLLAILLRRAKRRCRPLWRTVVARTLQSAAILIVCFILYVTWFLSGTPEITTDYLAQFNQMARPTADESQNAAPLYDKAIELLNQPSDDFLRYFAQNYIEFTEQGHMEFNANLPSQITQLLDNPNDPNSTEKKKELAKETTKNMGPILRIKPHQTTSPQRRLIEKWTSDQQQALETVTAANEKPHYWRQYETGSDGSMFSILLPHLSISRDIARTLCWRAYLHAENADFDTASSDIKTCYRLGRHLKTNQILIEQLVGIAIETLATETLRDILSTYQLTTSQLKTLQQDFEKLVANEAFTVDFHGEKLMILDEIQRCFTRSGHLYIPRMLGADDDINSYPSAINITLSTIITPWYWPRAVSVLTHPDKKQTKQKANVLYDFFQTVAHKTPAQSRAENMDIEEKTNEMIKGNLLLTILYPAGKIVEISHTAIPQLKIF